MITKFLDFIHDGKVILSMLLQDTITWKNQKILW